MRMLQEFKEFAIKGNAMDLAVGVIIGAAFGKIVDSIVKDLIMPLAGLVFGKLDFSNLFVVLGKVPPDTAMTLDALKTAGVPVFAYGRFITVCTRPLPKVLVPITTARSKSCSDPLVISAAEAVLPFTSTTTGMIVSTGST